jgi:hypothetical protein
VTALSVVSVLVENLMEDSAAFLPVLRILRLVRIFKLIPRARGLRTLLRTVYWWVLLYQETLAAVSSRQSNQGGAINLKHQKIFKLPTALMPSATSHRVQWKLLLNTSSLFLEKMMLQYMENPA